MVVVVVSAATVMTINDWHQLAFLMNVLTLSYWVHVLMVFKKTEDMIVKAFS